MKRIILFSLMAAVLLAGGARGKTEDPFEVREETEAAGWDQVYAFPVSSDDVHFYDKSRPFPEIIKKFSEQPAYAWTGAPGCSGAFPLSVNSDVESWVRFWSGGKKSMRIYLERSGLYADMINHELSRRDMPPELFYLCMIESGFQAKVKSWAGARGLWQFITGTGKRYGLRIDYWVDERCDPEKSTDAALNYLSDLYGMFGDWQLAAASYNCGEERVARKLMETGCRDFWCLADNKALPGETRNYVPKLIGAAIVGSNLEKYGVYNVQFLSPLRYTQVTVDDATDLRVIAKCSNTSIKEIEFLNPELTWWCTPPKKGYKVNIPYGRAQEFYVAYSQLNNEDRSAFKRHVVKAGESVDSIAYSYGTRDTKMLASMNDITVGSKLSPGQTLVVPVPKDRAYKNVGDYKPRSRDGGDRVLPDIDVDYVEPGKTWDRDKPSRKDKPGKSVKTPKAPKDRESKGEQAPDGYMEYTIEPDDTLWVIASWSGRSVDELKRLNGIKDETALQYGDKIKIPTDKGRVRMPDKPDKPKYKTSGPTRTIEYTVRDGDRCYYIARHYGIHSTEIIDKNNLDPNCSIQPNQKLTLVVPKDAPTAPPPQTNDASTSKKETASLDTKKTAPKSAPGKGGKKTVYTVKSGDSMWQIARNHDTHVADIIAWNGLESSSVSVGQKLVIYPGGGYSGSYTKDPGSKSVDKSAPKSSDKTKPAAANPPDKAASSDKKSSSGGACKKPVNYVVKSGDSLWQIARNHDCRCDDIRSLNGMESDSVSPGQALKICPGPESGKSAAAAPKDSSPSAPQKAKTDSKGKKKITYVVKDGDSLWQIARDHDVHVVDVKAWNNMDSDSVRPGQGLTIYVEK